MLLNITECVKSARNHCRITLWQGAWWYCSACMRNQQLDAAYWSGPFPSDESWKAPAGSDIHNYSVSYRKTTVPVGLLLLSTTVHDFSAFFRQLLIPLLPPPNLLFEAGYSLCLYCPHIVRPLLRWAGKHWNQPDCFCLCTCALSKVQLQERDPAFRPKTI